MYAQNKRESNARQPRVQVGHCDIFRAPGHVGCKGKQVIV